MKRSAVEPLRFAALAGQTEIGGGFSRISRALRIAPLALCAALMAVGAANAALPAGYLRLTSITATGTQYINTGVNAQSGTKAEIEFTPLSVQNSNCHLLGAIGGTTRVYFLAYGTSGFGYGYKTFSLTGTSVTEGTRYTVLSILEEGAQSFSTNGVVVATGTTTGSININCNLFLCGYNSNGTAYGLASVRLYRCRIWQKDANGDYQLVRDFEPCSKDYEAGLFDLVEDKFYKNAGTGSFTMGGVIVAATAAKAIGVDSREGVATEDGVRSIDALPPLDIGYSPSWFGGAYPPSWKPSDDSYAVVEKIVGVGTPEEARTTIKTGDPGEEGTAAYSPTSGREKSIRLIHTSYDGNGAVIGSPLVRDINILSPKGMIIIMR